VIPAQRQSSLPLVATHVCEGCGLPILIRSPSAFAATLEAHEWFCYGAPMIMEEVGEWEDDEEWDE
jgi:hypothetical protein